MFDGEVDLKQPSAILIVMALSVGAFPAISAGGTTKPPKAPKITSVVAGDGKLTVSWSAPSSALPITSYAASAAGTAASCSTASLTCSISGLTNFATYAVTVTATSTAGISVPSKKVWGTPQGAVGAPTIGLGVLTGTKVTVPIESYTNIPGATFVWTLDGVDQPVAKTPAPFRFQVPSPTYDYFGPTLTHVVSVKEVVGESSSESAVETFHLTEFMYRKNSIERYGWMGSSLDPAAFHLSGLDFSCYNPPSPPSPWLPPPAAVCNNFHGANFAGANLKGSTFSGTDLGGANLSVANLSNSVFHCSSNNDGHRDVIPSCSSLVGSNLDGADLSGADLTGAATAGISGVPAALPVGWSLVNGYLAGPGAIYNRGIVIFGLIVIYGASCSGAPVVLRNVCQDIGSSGPN